MRRVRAIRGIATLLALTALAAAAGAAIASGAYTTRVVNSTAGGDPGYFYVGGPLNITLKDHRGGSARYQLCMSPAPIDRPACRMARLNRTVDSLAPSKSGKTKLRFKLAGHKVLIRYIRVRRAASAAHASGPTGRLHVCRAELRLYKHPASLYIGLLKRDQTITVQRYSRSGKYAFGLAHGHAAKHGWVLSVGVKRRC
jgi:hypothetical protein